MSRERALAHLAKWGREKDAVFTERPTFTVAQAALGWVDVCKSLEG